MHVGHEKRKGVGLSSKLYRLLPTNDAVRTFAAHQPAGFDTRLLLPANDAGDDTVTLLLIRSQFGLPSHLVAPIEQVTNEDALRLTLRNHNGPRFEGIAASSAARRNELQLKKPVAPSVNVDRGRIATTLEKFINQTHPRQSFRYAILEADRFGMLRWRVSFFDYCNAKPQARQQTGDGQSDGARTNDQDIKRLVHRVAQLYHASEPSRCPPAHHTHCGSARAGAIAR